MFLDYLLLIFLYKIFVHYNKTLFVNSLLLWQLVSVKFDHFQALSCRSIHVDFIRPKLFTITTKN